MKADAKAIGRKQIAAELRRFYGATPSSVPTFPVQLCSELCTHPRVHTLSCAPTQLPQWLGLSESLSCAPTRSCAPTHTDANLPNADAPTAERAAAGAQ